MDEAAGGSVVRSACGSLAGGCAEMRKLSAIGEGVCAARDLREVLRLVLDRRHEPVDPLAQLFRDGFA